MTITWTKWDEEVIKEMHGNVYFYRMLYEGRHSEIFSRAKDLIEKGEIVDRIVHGELQAKNVRTPYIIANISKVIPEIPATLVARSIGDVKSSIVSTEEQNESTNQDTDEIIEGAQGAANEKIDNLQQELIEQIEKNSKLKLEHWGNIVQHQVDGGLVGVPWMDKRGLRIDFKQRDVYYPHEDGLGCDLAYQRKINEDYYLHVYRERVEEDDLHVSHMLFQIEQLSTKDEAKAAGGYNPGSNSNYASSYQGELSEIDEEEAKQLLGIEELETVYTGRSRPFVVYWPNEKTFMNPLGVSCLKGQDSKQDEINWTLTRNAIVYERNGKPRMAISKEIMQALQERAFERYGDESKIDHRDLEITTFDDKGKAMEIIQIDITKIGSLEWVKDSIRIMLMETRTAQKAVDLYDENGGAQSGTAKFYDLLVSILKAEQLQGEYIYFLKQLFENCLWLANLDDSNVIVEEPNIQLKDMIPVSRNELVESNNKEFTDGTASLETVVRRNNPYASEEWIEEELARIEEGKQGDDTLSLVAGRQTLNNLQDNRDSNGDPIKEDNPEEVIDNES